MKNVPKISLCFDLAEDTGLPEAQTLCRKALHNFEFRRDRVTWKCSGEVVGEEGGLGIQYTLGGTSKEVSMVASLMISIMDNLTK